MTGQPITISAMAKRMDTARRQPGRLLDPIKQSVTLATLCKAAAAARTMRAGLTWNKGF